MGGDDAAILLGRYRLDRQLGVGGMGTVWRASDLLLRRDVAVKLMASQLRLDPVSWERFRREAQYQGGLRHPGITEVYDYGEHEGQPFIVMEFLDGSDILALLRAHPGGLPAARTVDLATQAAAALAYLHDSDILHRDIKPANLFLARDGQLKVCDFGVAKSLGSASITSAGTRLGTWAYLAPEVWLGEEATASSDLYALGCVLHEMLTGQPPFPVQQSEAALRRLHLQDSPPPLRGEHPVPERLGKLVGELMSKDPQARPASARDVVDELRAIGDIPEAALSPDDLLTPRPVPASESLPLDGSPLASGNASASTPVALTIPRTSQLPPGYYEAPAPIPPALAFDDAAVQAAAFQNPAVQNPAVQAPAVQAPAIRQSRVPAAGSGPAVAHGRRPRGDLPLWTWAARVSAWIVFVTTVALCVAIAAGHLAPEYRLFVLVPAALYTLPGAVAVSRATVSRVAPVALGFVSFWIAEAAAILVASPVRPSEAWSAIMALAWAGGVALAICYSK